MSGIGPRRGVQKTKQSSSADSAGHVVITVGNTSGSRGWPSPELVTSTERDLCGYVCWKSRATKFSDGQRLSISPTSHSITIRRMPLPCTGGFWSRTHP
jgi:hypothetical protein